MVAASPASAAERCGNPLISACINDDTLWPHAGPAQFLGVGGSETVAKGQVGFGLVTSYLSRPITLHLPSPGPGGSSSNAINDQVNGTFLWAYGVTDRLELDVALPITFGQGGGGVQSITGGAGVQDTAMRDMRFGAAWSIVPRARVAPLAQNTWALAARFETSAPTGDEGQFAGERAAVFVPSIAGDVRLDRFFAAAELGARLRPTAELVGARVGSQLVVAAGAGLDLFARHDLLAIAAEARALPILVGQHASQQTPQGLVSVPCGDAGTTCSSTIIPAEWAVSARTAPLVGGDLAFILGGGGALNPDAPITTPRFRFTLSIRYAPLARDTDGDGVLDRDDRCPSQPGSRESGGCEPVKPAIPPAFEMRPGNPACDEDPPTVGGFRDDGCPNPEGI
jgi:hypothetical protein